MKKILFLLCLAANVAFAQNSDDDSHNYTPKRADTTFVIAAEGMDLYEKPQKTAKILMKIACGAALKPLETDDRDEYMLNTLHKSRTTINDLEGFWLKINYKNTVGYGFTAFLHTTKPDSITTDCAFFLPNMDYNDISYKNTNDFNWYGIYKKDKLRLSTKKVESVTFFKKNAVSRYEAQHYSTTQLQVKAKQSSQATTADSLCYVIGLRKKNNTTITYGMLPESTYMGGLPNKNNVLGDEPESPDQIPIGATDWRLKLDKTYTRTAPKKEGEQPTAELADWKLMLVRNDFRQKQVFTNKTTAFAPPFFSPPFALACYGDFDEDGKLDFILNSNQAQQLYMSSAAAKTELVKCAATLWLPPPSKSILLVR